MKILVLGYFGYIENKLDGQTVKTRNVYDLLKSRVDDVDFFNTEEIHHSKMSLFTMFVKFCKSSTVFYPAAGNSLKYFFPILFILSKIFRVKINFIQIGGWLVNFLSKNPIHKYMLAHINCVFAETELMKQRLEEVTHLTNVSLLSNFRMDASEHTINHTDGMLRCVFMARVMKEKGIEIIFDLSRRLHEEGLNVEIDFYGKVAEKDETYFTQKIKENPNTHYLGALSPDNINEALCKYDVMLLPTKYYTEGFPGSILEAYIAGIPVVVSDFQHAKELVEDGVTGFIFKGGDVISRMEDTHPIQEIIFNDESLKEFYSIITKLLNEPDLVLSLKENAYKESFEYRPEAAWKVIEPTL